MYEPSYSITHKILRLIGKIEGARELIENAALVPAYEKQFRDEALSRTVHHGTHLEGNGLSQEQARKIILSDETMAEQAAQKVGIVGRDRDIQEVINYRRVMVWIDEHGNKANKAFQIDDTLLKAIHELSMYRILPEEERGHYREVQVVVKNSVTGEVSYRPPLAVEVPFQIEDFFEWLNSDEGKQHHSILRAGIAHYELVRIHPFTDGNGRTARALALLLMYAEGYDVKRFFSIEEYFDTHAPDYYSSLQSVSNSEEKDLTNWLEYFVEGLAIELDKVKQEVLKLSRDSELKTRMGGHQVALSERQITIMKVLRDNEGKAYSNDFTDALPDVSLDTVLRDVKELIDKGLMQKKGKTKGAYYVLTE